MSLCDCNQGRLPCTCKPTEEGKIMSEVKRYEMCGFGGGLVESKEGAWYHMDDFDRVTAEREASRYDWLQAAQAAEKRVEVLERLLREVLEFIDDGVGRSDAEWKLIQSLQNALEMAE